MATYLHIGYYTREENIKKQGIFFLKKPCSIPLKEVENVGQNAIAGKIIIYKGRISNMIGM